MSERGKLVGTLEPPAQDPPENWSQLLALKGQKLHELEVEAALLEPDRAEELARVVKRRFKLK